MTQTIIFPCIEEYLQPYFQFFPRCEGREVACKYITGLLMDGERKSVEPMSERVSGSERSMQRLLSNARWDHIGLLEEYRKQMLKDTIDPQGVLAIDDTGFPKKGRHIACVSRQYCGATEKIDNCQIGVSMSYIGQGIAWPYVMDLFVPKSWDNLEDPDCMMKRKKTRMPESARFREKWRIALEQIDIAMNDGVPHRAVVADSWYGDIPEFRRELAKRNENYVLGIHNNTQVFIESPLIVEYESQSGRGRPMKYPKFIATNAKPVNVSIIGEKVEEQEWEHLELRQGSNGKPLVIEAFSMRVYPSVGFQKGVIPEEVWLLIERRRHKKGGFELRYFLSNLPSDMPTIEILCISHERFWIEHGYQQLKDELGLDHHEGRSWIGWQRHVILVFLAFGYLTKLRIHEKKRLQEKIWKKRLMLAQTTGKEFSV